jgi:hypothetical protein
VNRHIRIRLVDETKGKINFIIGDLNLNDFLLCHTFLIVLFNVHEV